MRDKVFISYSHLDETDFKEFEKHLSPARLDHVFDVWHDQRIPPGEDWEKAIRAALDQARVGLLLVSGNFLASKFIEEVELKTLFQAAQGSELSLFWVPLSASMFKRAGLGQWQAAPGCDPDHPLDSLSNSEKQKTIVGVCEAIAEKMGSLSSMTRDDRNDLKARVATTVGDNYRNLTELGAGSSSICYKARDWEAERDVVVKALVESRLRPDRNDDLRERVKIAKNLVHRAYIRIHEDFIKATPYCIVTEYVDGFDLCQLPRGPDEKVAVRDVHRILLDLARALAEAHAHGHLHEGLLPSNVHIERHTHRPRISAFRFLTIGPPPTGLWGTFLVNHETCTYLSPEQFDGLPRTVATDQYALGLIGYELLSGEPLRRVSCPADFVDRRRVYSELEQPGAWTARAPDLGAVISRMLRIDPAERWKSMAQVAAELEDVEVQSAQDAARHLARKSYRAFQARDRAHALYGCFYQKLFDEVPEAEPLFQSKDESRMARQYRALNEALRVLLDYDPASQSAADEIAAMAGRHRQYGLNDGHIDAFEAALWFALQEGGVTEAETLAWRTALAPGLLHMRRALRGEAPVRAARIIDDGATRAPSDEEAMLHD
jgi:serine/threonine protein kinase